jgi:hypothetical protein
MATQPRYGRPRRRPHRRLNLNLAVDLIEQLDAEVERTGIARSRLIERLVRLALKPA